MVANGGFIISRWVNKSREFQKWIDSQDYEFSQSYGWFSSELGEYEAFSDYDDEPEDKGNRDDPSESGGD